MTDTSTQGAPVAPTDNGTQTGQAPPSAQQTADGAQQDPWADPDTARSEIERLRRESAGYRTQVRELEPLAAAAREAEEANKSELEKATGRLTELEAKATEANLLAARYEVAMANGLTLDQAGRLRGTTKEELEADVEQLRKDLGLEAVEPAAPPPGQRVPLGQGGGPGSEQLTDMNDWMRSQRSR